MKFFKAPFFYITLLPLLLPASLFAESLSCEVIQFYLKALNHFHYNLTPAQTNHYIQNAFEAALDELEISDQNERDKILDQESFVQICIELASLSEKTEGKANEKLFSKILKQIDPYTMLLTPSQFESFDQAMKGTAKALGIRFRLLGENNVGPFQIIKVIPGSQAYKRGLQVDDIVLSIDEKNTQDMSKDELNSVIQSAISGLSFEVQRATEVIKIEGLRKEELSDTSVSYHALNAHGLAYIKIDKFTRHTHLELAWALYQLQTAYRKDLKGIVLDLRDNPGGLMDSIVNVVDQFIHKGPILFTLDRNNEHLGAYTAEQSGQLTSAPLVILINNRSASGSEIVSGTLQDYHRALILGTNSFGKGTVLTGWELNDTQHDIFQAIPDLRQPPQSNYKGMLVFTKEVYFLPSGKTPQLFKIAPDIIVKDPKREALNAKIKKENPNAVLYEIDYPNAIHTESLETTFKPPYNFKLEAFRTLINSGRARTHFSEIEQDDIQLSKAIDILKIITHQDTSQTHFTKAHYYRYPYHRIHLNTDLYEDGAGLIAKFTFKNKKRRYGFFGPWDKEVIYETYGFITGNELTLSLQNTKASKYMEEEVKGSLILEITLKKTTLGSDNTQETEVFEYDTFIFFDTK